jgi:hypothetical protein
MKGNYVIADRFLEMGEKIARDLEDEKALELVYEEMINLYRKTGDTKKITSLEKKLKNIRP